MGSYRHIVLFRLHDEVSEDEVAQVLALLRSLGELPGIVRWRVARSLDDRKGTVVVEDATFESAEAFAAFRDCDEHRAAGERLRALADWLIGDYEEPSGI